jgi:hypothetical protein
MVYTVGKMLMCQGCKNVHYCSKECQGSDWDRHKNDPSVETHIQNKNNKDKLKYIHLFENKIYNWVNKELPRLYTQYGHISGIIGRDPDNGTTSNEFSLHAVARNKDELRYYTSELCDENEFIKNACLNAEKTNTILVVGLNNSLHRNHYLYFVLNK